jgi:hypothetical protein
MACQVGVPFDFPAHSVSHSGGTQTDAGKGDRPIKDLKFRCAQCGSRLTDWVVMGKGAMDVQPWRQE